MKSRNRIKLVEDINSRVGERETALSSLSRSEVYLVRVAGRKPFRRYFSLQNIKDFVKEQEDNIRNASIYVANAFARAYNWEGN